MKKNLHMDHQISLSYQKKKKMVCKKTKSQKTSYLFKVRFDFF